MIRGGTPAVAAPTIRARGVRPCRRAAASLATSSAQAPSLTPEALPAVTVPSGRTIGASFASASARRRARMLVAVDDPRRALLLRHRARRRSPAPACRSAAPPARAPASATRTRPGRRARSRTPRRRSRPSRASSRCRSGACSSGLTKRQPSVVSSILAAREKALSALARTNGARLMLSTPPASISSASPARIARAAVASASSPEPQSRLIVDAGHRVRQAREQRRHPRHVAVVLAGLVGAAVVARRRRPPSRPRDGAPISARIGTAARSSARTDDSAPP